MRENIDIDLIKNYFNERLDTHGATPRGADWNSPQAQETRFDQLLKIIADPQDFTFLDYGCGYGALLEYIEKKGLKYRHFNGFDILESMVIKAKEIFQTNNKASFFSELQDVPIVDYAVASGVFNIRLKTSYEDWTQYTLTCLDQVNQLTKKGFSCNFLTKYSDADRMMPQLYYADPCFLFDYCKTHYSKNVALLHDYNLYDFTILVRKDD